jgi:6-pyruvoyltetrahydropterin/6-carboxytetrahydropterin synthase
MNRLSQGFRIARTHEIAIGHRVAGHESKCSHLHGHNIVVTFIVAPDANRTLDDIGRVLDFSVIKSRLCQWLEDNWDHRMLLWCDDPWLPTLRSLDPHVTPLPVNPTAENLARYLVEQVGPEMLAGTGVSLISCTVHETSKCSATYD